MARIRTIKPDFWVDEKVVEVSAFARLLFIGLWNFADDVGRMEYRPNKIKMQIFPADSLDISELIGELRGESLVNVYVVEGKEYLGINGFSKHQKIDKRLNSKHPPPAGSPQFTPTEGIKEGIKEVKEHTSDSAESDIRSGEFEEIWQSRPRRPNESKLKARKANNARRREGAPHVGLLAGTIRYAAYCKAECIQGKHTMHLATFLGPDEHWQQRYEILGKVPTDKEEIRRLVAERHIQLSDDAGFKEARKRISQATGMSL